VPGIADPRHCLPLGATGDRAQPAADGSIAGPAYSVDLPVALRLDFAAAAVWFVAGIPQLPDMRRVFIPGDEVMVVFSREKMRDMGFDDPAFLQATR
jgi:hypothetical protein